MNRILIAFFLALGAHGLLLYVGSAWVSRPLTVKPPVRQVNVSLARAPRKPAKPKAVKTKTIEKKTPQAKPKPKAVVPKKKPAKKIVKKIVRPRPARKKTVVPEKPKNVEPETPKPVEPEKPKPEDLEKEIAPVDLPPENVPDQPSESESEAQPVVGNPLPPSMAPPSAPTDSGATNVSANSDAPAGPPVLKARPLYRENPSPRYPRSAKRRGLQGKVVLQVLVDRTGRASNVTVAESSGHGILDRAALATVKDWLFEPGTRGGVAVDMQVLVPIQFRLN